MTITDTAVDTRGIHGPAVKRITARQMLEAGKLKTLDQVREELALTDNVEGVTLPVDGSTRFRLGDSWFVGIENKPDDHPVDAYIWASGRELRLTKKAMEELCSDVGLTKTYVAKTPPRLIQPHLDYWYASPDRQTKVLVVNDHVRGVTKATFSAFSNLQLLDRAMREVAPRFGEEVYFDFKTRHNLQSTNLLMVIPESARDMRPEDNWSGGLQLMNSLVGDHSTEVGSYLFRWWCTNGATTRGSKGNAFKRTASQNRDAGEVFDWLGASVRSALDRLENEFDRVQAMTTEPIEGEVRTAIANLARTYRLSSQAQEAIRNEMLETSDVTMYGLMNAVTRAAQRRGFPVSVRERMMDLAGDFVHGAGRCDSCHSVLVDHDH